jgi:hypothetical protein
MSPRTPPRLAIWLLTRSGFAHQNPPLAGDLLEEFRSGRSAAWFWRQTLIVIFTGLAQNAKRFKRLHIAFLIGWATQAGVDFGLWRLHLPAQLHGRAGTIAWFLTAIAAFLLAACANALLLRRRRRSTDEVLESWSHLDDETAKRGRTILLRTLACISCCACLAAYCLQALLSPVSLGVFFLYQAALFLVAAAGALTLISYSGPATLLTTRK